MSEFEYDLMYKKLNLKEYPYETIFTEADYWEKKEKFYENPLNRQLNEEGYRIFLKGKLEQDPKNEIVRKYNINGKPGYFAGNRISINIGLYFRPSKRYDTLEEVRADARRNTPLLMEQLLEGFLSKYPQYIQCDEIGVSTSCVAEDCFIMNDDYEGSYKPLGDGKWEIHILTNIFLYYYGRINTKEHPCALDNLSMMRVQASFLGFGLVDLFLKYIKEIDKEGKITVDGGNPRFDADIAGWIEAKGNESFIIPWTDEDPGIGSGEAELYYTNVPPEDISYKFYNVTK